jgi:hypothetical protein
MAPYPRLGTTAYKPSSRAGNAETRPIVVALPCTEPNEVVNFGDKTTIA